MLRQVIKIITASEILSASLFEPATHQENWEEIFLADLTKQLYKLF